MEFPSREEDPLPEGLEINLSPQDRFEILAKLRKDAKKMMDEQGINVLYLSFGFLRWAETDAPRDFYEAPLILVTVSLTYRSINAPFILSLREDDIVVNPTLAYKLDHDFCLKLPDLTTEDTPASYFEKIRPLLNTLWEILPEVELASLFFLKINMYHDLEANKEAILNHLVVRALCGDASALSHEAPATFDHDARPSEETFQIVDADSSQQDAAKKE